MSGAEGGSSSSSSSAGGCEGGFLCPSPPQIKLYQTLVFATPVLFSCLLFLLFCMLCIRRRRSTARFNSQIRAHLFSRAFFSTGLSKSFRQGLPIILFNEKFAESRQDTQCVVCLGNYQPNEKLRQLPGCGHCFHVECIDEWLANNVTCPICRISLLKDDRGIQVNPSMVELSRDADSQGLADRVVSENMDGNPEGTSDICKGESSNGVASSISAAILPGNEDVVDLERS